MVILPHCKALRDLNPQVTIHYQSSWEIWHVHSKDIKLDHLSPCRGAQQRAQVGLSAAEIPMHKFLNIPEAHGTGGLEH